MILEPTHSRKLRILVVEDESVVAILVEDMLLDLGFEVAGVASRLETGVAMARELAVDVAVLDVNLGNGVRSFSVADELRARNIPFVFATGYGRAGLVEAYAKIEVVQKPFRAKELERALERAMNRAESY